MPENVIIEFTAETSGLAPAVDQLEALGKIDKQAADVFKQTNAELNKRVQVTKLTSEEFKKTGLTLEQLAAKLRKGGDETKKLVEIEKQLRAEIEKIKNQLKSTNDELAKFQAGTTKTGDASKSLKTELLAITQQLAKLKLEGKDNTAQYIQLAATASKYRDALGDVSREINRAASDTRKLDTMVEFATGVAGAFSIAQGAAGLFGDKSEKLQEVLLRVQSAMAVLNGLQAIQNILQKESNLVRAVTNAQLKIQVITTNLETAATSKNVIVKGLATGAMRVLNTVMKANPVFLLISAFALLAGALAFFTGRTNDAEKATAQLNAELEALRHNTEIDRAALSAATELDLKRLELRGAKESTLQARRIQAIKDNIAIESKLSDDLFEKTRKSNEADEESRKSLMDDAQENAKTLRGLNTELQKAEVELAIIKRDESKEANEQAVENTKKRIEKEKALRLANLEDIKAGIELQLLEVAKGSQAEIDLKKRLSIAELNIGLENEKLTANQRKLLIQKSLNERLQLEKDFSAEVKKISLENLQSNLNAELQNIDISNQRKEDLTVQLLEVQRQLELAAVTGNKQKEKEVNAKFDKEISDQAVAIRKAGLDQELQLITAQQGARQRALTKQSTDSNADITTRIFAINELFDIEKASIDKRKALNDNLFKDGLISAKEFTLTSEELEDAKAKASEDAEERIRAARKQTDDETKERNKKLIETILEIASQVAGTINMLNDLQSEKENQRLEGQRRNLDELRKSGAITEKEAIARMKLLDIEENKIRQKQAQRDKSLALFQAIINTAASVTKVIYNPILAAIAAALGAAQIALIAARPVPKFGRGKKNQYEGVGQVGETGPELVEKGGKYYYAEKPQIVWLAKSDKVYNPKETIDMINRPLPNIDKRIMNFSNSTSSKLSIDYEKLGKAVGKNIPTFGLNIDENGFTEFQKNKNDFTKYLNNRRSF